MGEMKTSVNFQSGWNNRAKECIGYPGGGVLLGILGRGVLPGSPNPDPISEQIN